jgi:hypothetical protein
MPKLSRKEKVVVRKPSAYIQEQRDKIHAIVEEVYRDAGQSAVYDLFPGDARCEACETGTPSIADTCAICGQVRES